MTLKPGSKTRGMRPELLLGLIVADAAYRAIGVELVVTEVTGSTHKPGSLHYVGLAADLRTSNVPDAQRGPLLNQLKVTLGVEFDVVIEEDHIHIEFQPKAP